MRNDIIIRLIRFEGRAGGFATVDTDRWTVELANLDTNESTSLEEFETGGYGYSEKEHALQAVKRIQKVLD